MTEEQLPDKEPYTVQDDDVLPDQLQDAWCKNGRVQSLGH
ncbi:hypothetical protein QFZ23_002450 [Arthrobacter globiformis]|nr:hypothetical protein [Arthrobacter globiformis]